MKQCVICGALADDREAYCRNCGADITRVGPAVPQGPAPANIPAAGNVPEAQTAPGGQTPSAAPKAPVPPQTAMPPQAPPPPQMMMQAPPWSPYPFSRRRPFTWADICTVLGFASSIIGWFWASVLLLPLGLVTSVLGFRGDRTRTLAVAGIVVSAIGLLVKIMAILYEATWLPSWFTNGIW